MPERRRMSRRVGGILVVAAGLAAMIIGVKAGFFRAGRGDSRSIAPGAAAIHEKSSIPDLTRGLRAGNSRALVFLQKQLPTTPSDAPRAALGDEDAGQWLEALSGLRTAFVGFNGSARAIAVSLSYRILDRFAVEPAPARWGETLQPVHDLLSAGMADADSNVRAAALGEIAKVWAWLPGRSLTPAEESALASWKESLYRPVVRCLGNRDPRTLVAAVACLGSLPIDNAAAPAIAYVQSKYSDVRKQTLISFARRNLLLTDDMVLNRLHDEDPLIRMTAVLILKSRGLTQEQIDLGGLIFSPKSQERISVIPFLKDRTDIDPVVWLIQLSRDSEEMVRITAIEALAAHKTPSVRKRLAEMARSDQSSVVRQTASRHIASSPEKTVSLPPLPGSPNLNPRAN
jgi:HEAT repeats/HEAT repeat associated with sister chromatid cohesion